MNDGDHGEAFEVVSLAYGALVYSLCLVMWLWSRDYLKVAAKSNGNPARVMRNLDPLQTTVGRRVNCRYDHHPILWMCSRQTSEEFLEAVDPVSCIIFNLSQPRCSQAFRARYTHSFLPLLE
jgi:hypothetical protein